MNKNLRLVLGTSVGLVLIFTAITAHVRFGMDGFASSALGVFGLFAIYASFNE